MDYKLLTVVLLSLASLAVSLECFVCKDCESNGNDRVSCSAYETMCMKRFSQTEGGSTVTERECASAESCDLGKQFCNETVSLGSKCEASCCDTDFCNGGATPHNSAVVALVGCIFCLVASGTA